MNSLRDKDTDIVVDQAAQWVVRLSAADATLEDQHEFVVWLKRSPVHLDEYLRVERTWSGLGHVDAQRRLDVAALLAADDNNVVELNRPVVARVRRPAAMRAIAALAACALLACVALAWFQLQFADRYATGIGEQRTLRLADGSTVVLNTDTTLRVSFTDAIRDVHLLQGEALFNVAKDAAHPFRVHSGSFIAQAVGTSFVVRRKSEQTTVTVIEGEVAVADYEQVDDSAKARIPEHAVRVSAGVRASLADKAIRTAAVANPEAVTAWRSGRLIFDGETLSEVAAEFNRYNEVQISVGDPLLAGERISGVFDADQPRALVRFLERSGVVEPVPASSASIALVPRR